MRDGFSWSYVRGILFVYDETLESVTSTYDNSFLRAGHMGEGE